MVALQLLVHLPLVLRGPGLDSHLGEKFSRSKLALLALLAGIMLIQCTIPRAGILTQGPQSLKGHTLCRLNWLIVLGVNNTSTLVGHFVSSPREREKRDRRDEREGQGRKRTRMKVKKQKK